MARSLFKNRAIELRRHGRSVKDIAQELGVAKSTASLWVRDVILTIEQLEQLKKSQIKGRERGRIIGALVQKQARLKRIEEAKVEGRRTISSISKREMLLVGLALYAGEGNKTREVRFCNSDPKIINFMINWLIICFGINRNQIRLAVGINEAHRSRELLVKDYWSKTTNLPLSCFVKTSFKKTSSHKIYENFNEHFGTLDVRILQSKGLYYKIGGLIEALLGQGSSVVVARIS